MACYRGGMQFAMPLPGSSDYMMLCLGAWMTGASAAAYVVFGLDLRRAAAGGARVPQGTLLWIAGMGGWPGALVAEVRSRVGRHTGAFRGLLNAIVLMQTMMLVLMLAPATGLPAAFASVGQIVSGGLSTAEAKPTVRRFGESARTSRSARASTYLCRGDSC